MTYKTAETLLAELQDARAEIVRLTLALGRVGTLFDAIKHGDEDHRAWLKEAIAAHFAGQPVPPARGRGRKEAAYELALGEMRERCAAAADDVYRRWPEGTSSSWECGMQDAGEQIGKAIRALPLPSSTRLDQVKVLVEALQLVEGILAFHEGSESPTHEGGKPVVWINAQGPDGDFQEMLAKVRAALAACSWANQDGGG